MARKRAAATIAGSRSTTYRLGNDIVQLIERLTPVLAAELGVNLSRADVVRLAIRQLAERHLGRQGRAP